MLLLKRENVRKKKDLFSLIK